MFLAPAGATEKRAAFTLLELLVVLTLVALLTGLVLGAGRHAGERGRAARVRAELAALSVALDAYRRAYGDYPHTDDEAQLLQSLLGRRGPLGSAAAGRPWLEMAGFTTADARDPFTDAAAVLVDPWDRPYVYAYKIPSAGWSNSSYLLYSLGPDGKEAAPLLPGGFVDTAPPENADNLYANRP
jgi:general secretion pathway protein G